MKIKKGFTLIEVLVALGILTIGILPIFQLIQKNEENQRLEFFMREGQLVEDIVESYLKDGIAQGRIEEINEKYIFKKKEGRRKEYIVLGLGEKLGREREAIVVETEHMNMNGFELEVRVGLSNLFEKGVYGRLNPYKNNEIYMGELVIKDRIMEKRIYRKFFFRRRKK